MLGKKKKKFSWTSRAVPLTQESVKWRFFGFFSALTMFTGTEVGFFLMTYLKVFKVVLYICCPSCSSCSPKEICWAAECGIMNVLRFQPTQSTAHRPTGAQGFTWCSPWNRFETQRKHIPSLRVKLASLSFCFHERKWSFFTVTLVLS